MKTCISFLIFFCLISALSAYSSFDFNEAYDCIYLPNNETEIKLYGIIDLSISPTYTIPEDSLTTTMIDNEHEDGEDGSHPVSYELIESKDVIITIPTYGLELNHNYSVSIKKNDSSTQRVLNMTFIQPTLSSNVVQYDSEEKKIVLPLPQMKCQLSSLVLEKDPHTQYKVKCEKNSGVENECSYEGEIPYGEYTLKSGTYEIGKLTIQAVIQDATINVELPKCPSFSNDYIDNYITITSPNYDLTKIKSIEISSASFDNSFTEKTPEKLVVKVGLKKGVNLILNSLTEYSQEQQEKYVFPPNTVLSGTEISYELKQDYSFESKGYYEITLVFQSEADYSKAESLKYIIFLDDINGLCTAKKEALTITCLFSNVPIATEPTQYTLYFACGYQNQYSAKTFNYYTIELFKPVNCFTNINQHGKDNFLLKVNSKDNTNIQNELSAKVIETNENMKSLSGTTQSSAFFRLTDNELKDYTAYTILIEDKNGNQYKIPDLTVYQTVTKIIDSSKPIYSGLVEQELSITFKDGTYKAIDEIQRIMLWKEYSVLEIDVATQCGKAMNTLICKGLKLLAVPAGQYMIKILNYCGEEETISSATVTVKINPIVSADTIFKIQDTDNTGSMIIKYESSIKNSLNDIQILLRKKDDNSKEITFDYSEIINSDDLITLQKTVSPIDEGVYSLVTKYSTLNVEYVYDKDIIVILNKDLELENSPDDNKKIQYLTAHLNDNLNSIEIIFKSPLFKERITTISYREPSTIGLNTPIESNDYEINDKIIRLNAKVELNQKGLFTVQIDDILNNNYFVYIVVPSSVQYDSYFSYSTTDGSNPSVVFTFAEKEITGLIGSIKALNNEIITFSFEASNINSETGTIEAVAISGDNLLSHIEGVKFYDKNNKWIMTQTTPITFVNKSFSLGFKKTSLTIPSTEGKIILESTVSLYEELKEKISFSLKDTKNVVEQCSIDSIIGKFIEVSCTVFANNGAYTLIPKSNDFKIDKEKNTILVTVSKGGNCEEGQYIDETGECKICEHFLHEGKCLTSCPEGLVGAFHKCYTSCKLVSDKDDYYEREDGKCHTECDKNYKKYYNNKCYKSCENASDTVKLYDYNNFCVEKCPNKLSGNQTTCIDECNEDGYPFDDDGICVSTCGSKKEYNNKCYNSCYSIKDDENNIKKTDGDKCIEKCEDSENNKYEYRNVCYSDCKSVPSPITLYNNSYQCVESCPTYIDVESNTCVNTCQSDENTNKYLINDKYCTGNKEEIDKYYCSLSDNVYKCYSSCVNTDNNIMLIQSGTHNCVKATDCNAIYMNKCYNSCEDVEKENDYQFKLYNNNKLCVEICPFYSYIDSSNHKQCTKEKSCSSLQVDSTNTVDYFIYEKQCYDKCSSVIPNKMLYTYNNKYCFEQCPYFYYIKSDEYICADDCKDTKFKIQNGNQCVSSCPEGKVEYNNKCYDNCVIEGITIYEDVSTKKCVIKCDENKVSYEHKCYSKCSDILNNVAIYKKGNICVGQCDGYSYNDTEDNFICVDTCPESYRYKWEITDPNGEKIRRCVSECPNMYYNRRCYDSCEDIDGVKMYKKSPEDKQCVPSCEKVFYDGVCYDKCSIISTELYTNEKECTKECQGFYDIKNKECVSNCPTDTYLYLTDKKCYDSCQDESLIDKKLFTYEDKKLCVEHCPFYFYETETERKCVDSCPSDYFINSENPRQCISSCENGYTYNNTCYDSCSQAESDHILYAYAFKCYEECPTGLFNDYDSKKCVAKCPSTSYLYNNTFCYKNCEDIAEAKESKIVKDTENMKCLISSCESFTNYNDQTCVDKCNDAQFLYKNTCYDSCQQVIDLGIAVTLYQHGHTCSTDSCESHNKKFYTSKAQCTRNCDSTGFTSIDVCVDTCESVDLYEEGEFKCTSTCSDKYGLYTDANGKISCVRCDDEEKFELIGQECYDKGKCPSMYVFNDELNKCQLKTEAKCAAGYCSEEGTNECNDIDGCVCKENYYGVTCDVMTIKEAKRVFNNKMEFLFSEENDIDWTAENTIGDLMTLSAIAEQSEAIVDDSSYAKVITKTKSELDKEIKNDSISHLIDFSIRAQLMKLKQLRGKKIRNLIDENQIKNDLLEILHKTSYQFSSLSSESPQTTKGDFVIYQTWSSSTPFENLKQNSLSFNISYVDLSNCSFSSDVRIVKIDMLKSANEIYNDETVSSGVYLYAYAQSEDERKEIDLPSQCASIQIFIPSYLERDASYLYYKSKGIDIYNKNDAAFNDKCYTNDQLEFDLTINDRNNLFANKTFSSVKENDCAYLEITNENYIALNCEVSANSFAYKFVDVSHNKMETDYVQIFKCPGEIKNFDKNAAIYVFSIVIGISLIVWIAVFVYGATEMQKSSNQLKIKAMMNDGMLQLHFKQVKSTETDVNVKTVESSNDINKIQLEEKKTLGSIFISNLYELHPIAGLFRPSVLVPLTLRLPLFVFNLCNMMTFCAIYYDEDYIHDRMFDSDRNKFKYPMKEEFPIIICSICTAMLLCVFVKVVMIVTYKKKETILEEVETKQSFDEKNEIVKRFNKENGGKRMMGMFFMILMITFDFYYCVVFCGLYNKTQRGWGYACIWTMFLVWVVFAPFFAFVVSVVETINCSDKCNYYLKKVFWY